MRVIIAIIQVVCIGMFICAGAAFADEHSGSDSGGCFKLDLSSLPIFGSSSEEKQESAETQEYREPAEYTYDATGRKVPVTTERSGTARPVH